MHRILFGAWEFGEMDDCDWLYIGTLVLRYLGVKNRQKEGKYVLIPIYN